MTTTDQLLELVMNDPEMERITRPEADPNQILQLVVHDPKMGKTIIPITWKDRVAELMDDGASRPNAEAIANGEREPHMQPIKVRIIDCEGLDDETFSQLEPEMLYVGNWFEIESDGELTFSVKLQNSKGEIVTIFPQRVGRYFEKGHSINTPALEMSEEQLASYLKMEASR